MATKKQKTVKVYDGKDDHAKATVILDRIATRIRAFAANFDAAMMDAGIKFDNGVMADLAHMGRATRDRIRQYVDTIPEYHREGASAHLNKQLDKLLIDFGLIDKTFPFSYRIPRTICNTPLDLIDAGPDGVNAKPIDPAPFDIHMDVEAYDELLDYITAQRRLFERYGYQVHTITEGLYQQGNFKELRAIVPRCEVEGITRLAKAGLV